MLRGYSTRACRGAGSAVAAGANVSTRDRAHRMPLDPIARMACYCCGVRMLDAQSRKPACGDDLAERFMDAEALAVFAPFRRFGSANAANAVRHRMIDHLLRARLADEPALQVVLLGAGFDTRAFRLRGGRWLELDADAVIALKEAKLRAADAPNPLTRRSIDFARERLADKLRDWLQPEQRLIVVLEGVTMYLSAAQLRDTSATLRSLMPRHTLICDLMDARFVRLYSGPIRRQIRKLGTDLAPAPDDPLASVEALGYRALAQQSIALRSAELGKLPLPRLLLRSVLRSLRDGYRVCVFEAEPGAVSGPAG
jgi:methyltransferase (TIGR00027 family)